MFHRRKTSYTAKELISIFLLDLEPQNLCTGIPSNVAHNVSFVIDTSCLKFFDDVKCDSMGSWKRVGSPSRLYHVEREAGGGGNSISLCRTESISAENENDLFSLKRIYYVNKSDDEVHKTIAILEGESYAFLF